MAVRAGRLQSDPGLIRASDSGNSSVLNWFDRSPVRLMSQAEESVLQVDEFFHSYAHTRRGRHECSLGLHLQRGIDATRNTNMMAAPVCSSGEMAREEASRKRFKAGETGRILH